VNGLRKDDDLNIRMSKKERRQLDRCARMASRRRQKVVKSGTLAREFIMAGVHLMLTEANAMPPAVKVA
jgi:hypothetical protein